MKPFYTMDIHAAAQITTQSFGSIIFLGLGAALFFGEGVIINFFSARLSVILFTITSFFLFLLLIGCWEKKREKRGDSQPLENWQILLYETWVERRLLPPDGVKTSISYGYFYRTLYQAKETEDQFILSLSKTNQIHLPKKQMPCEIQEQLHCFLNKNTALELDRHRRRKK